MSRNKKNKGDYEYASYHKKTELIKTLIMFALPIGIYITGYVTTHSNKNLLTVVAVLGMLPASKCLVSLIMNLRVKVLPGEARQEIDEHIHDIKGLYNLYFTSYDNNFYLAHTIVLDNSLIGYTTDSKFNDKKFKEHMEKHIQLEGLDGILIKVFNDKNAYIKRLDEINNSQTDKKSNEKLYNLLLSISL